MAEPEEKDVVEAVSAFDELDFDEKVFDDEEVEFQETQAALPESPYWRVDKKDFEKILRVISLISKSNVDVISKSVACSLEEGQLVMRSTDKDIYFTGQLNLSNEESKLEEDLILDSRQLIEVVKNSAELVLYMNEKTPYVNLLGGFYPLEKFAFDKNIFRIEEIPNEGVEVSGVDLLEELNLMNSALLLASRVEDKKIIISKSRAYGQFLTAGTSSSSVLPDMVLRARDVEVLRTILSLYANETILVISGLKGDRNWFVADSFVYSSTTTPGILNEQLLQKYESKEEPIYINGKQLYMILNFLDSPQTKMRAIHLNFSENGVKVITSSRKGSKSEFILSEGAFEPFNVELQASLAKKVFGVMKEFASISLEKGEAHILLVSDKMSSVMGVK